MPLRRRRPRADLAMILGCQRSGTTLLGLMLEAHPGVDLIEENDDRFHPLRDGDRRLDLPAAVQHRPADGLVPVFKAPRETHRLDEIMAARPSTRMIWIERDVRQVVASMIELTSGQRSWADRFARRECERHSAAHGDHARNVADAAEELGDEQRPAAMAALCWAVKIRQREIAEERWPDQVLRLDYESTVRAPASTAAAVTAFLGLRRSRSMHDHPSHVEPGARPGKTDATRPIDTASLDRWRNLDPSQLAVIDPMVEAYRRATVPAW